MPLAIPQPGLTMVSMALSGFTHSDTGADGQRLSLAESMLGIIGALGLPAPDSALSARDRLQAALVQRGFNDVKIVSLRWGTALVSASPATAVRLRLDGDAVVQELACPEISALSIRVIPS